MPLFNESKHVKVKKKLVNLWPSIRHKTGSQGNHKLTISMKGTDYESPERTITVLNINIKIIFHYHYKKIKINIKRHNLKTSKKSI